MKNLKDYITFCTAYYPDSEERQANFKQFLHYWSDSVSILCNDLIDPNFNRARIINSLAKKVKTPFMAIVDVDCIIDHSAIENAVELMSNGVDVCYPYTKIYNVDHSLKKLYRWKNPEITHKRLSYFFNDVDDDLFIPLEFSENKHFLGVIICFKTETFLKFGLENPNFNGWGFEDYERLVRAKKFKLNIDRLDHSCYHLDHGTSLTSRRNDLWKNNYYELLKVYNMTQQELERYVRTWH